MLCSPNKLKQELAKIKLFASYNGYPKRIVNSVIKKCDDMSIKKKEIHIDEHICNLYLALPYLGVKAEHIVKNTKRKLSHCFKKDKYVKFNILFKTTKLSFFIRQQKIEFLS